MSDHVVFFMADILDLSRCSTVALITT